MIVEQRTYAVRPGRIAEYLNAVETLGLPLMRPILGGFIGYFVTEVGVLNEVTHLWAYESLDDRARRRRELARHPDWPRFTDAVRPLFERQDNRILTPTAFTPLTLERVRAMNAEAVGRSP